MGKYNYIELKTMNLNLSYQYVGIIFNILKEKYIQLSNLNKCISYKRMVEDRLKNLSIDSKYSGKKLNKKILNNNKLIKEYNAEIDDLNDYIENIVNVRIMSYLRKLYYINDKLFNQGIFILDTSLSLDTKIENEKIDSGNSKFINIIIVIYNIIIENRVKYFTFT